MQKDQDLFSSPQEPSNAPRRHGVHRFALLIGSTKSCEFTLHRSLEWNAYIKDVVRLIQADFKTSIFMFRLFVILTWRINIFQIESKKVDGFGTLLPDSNGCPSTLLLQLEITIFRQPFVQPNTERMERVNAATK